MLTLIILLLTSLKSINAQLVQSSTWCNESFSCAFGQEIVDATIGCGGYFGCAFNTTLKSTYNDSNYYYGDVIDCDGSYSCYGSNKIEINGEYTSLDCNGLMSCADIKNISVDYEVLCNGESSCKGSNINYGYYLECRGFQSCNNVKAQATPDLYQYSAHIYVTGMLGAQNAVFYSSPDISYNSFSFYGPYSGVDATIVCAPDADCYIYCYGVEACNHNLQVLCDSTSGSYDDCDIIVNCQTFEDSWTSDSDCWNKTTGIFYSFGINDFWNNHKFYEIPDIPSLLDTSGQVTFESSSISNSIGICGLEDININNFGEISIDKDSIICGDVKECASTDVIADSGHICCLGGRSCYNANNMEPGSNGIIRCDGKFSCEDAATIDASNGNSGDIYFSGAYAVASTDYWSSSDVSIIGNGKNNIYCMGVESCYETGSITNINNAYLMGEYASSYTNFDQINGNVYAYAYYSEPIISNVKGNVYCGSDEACAWGDIENIGGDLYCYGEYTCYDIQLDGVINGTIYSVGTYAMYLAYVYAKVETIIIAGTNVLEYSDIHGAKNIIAYGDNVLGYGVEIFSSDYWNELYISINGTDNNDFEVKCSKGHICKIICSHDCDLVLDCQGECTLIGVGEVTHKSKSDDDVDTGLIIGFVIGGVVLCCIIGFAIYRYTKQKQLEEIMSNDGKSFAMVSDYERD